MSLDLSSAFQVNLLGNRLRVIGPAHEIHALREAFFSRCQESPALEADVILQIEAKGTGYRMYLMREEKELLSEVESLNDLFWELEYNFLSEAMSHHNNLIQVHGAAVERDGKALVFLGNSYAGKSTTVFHLIRHGYRFLTDEVVLIDPDTCRLKPFPRNLLLRSGALKSDKIREQLREGRWRYDDERGETKWMVDPVEAGATEEPQEARVVQVICMKREESVAPCLVPLGARAVVEEMLHQSYNNEHLGQRAVEAIIRIAQSAQTFRLQAPHAGIAWELLRPHLDIIEG